MKGWEKLSIGLTCRFEDNASVAGFEIFYYWFPSYQDLTYWINWQWKIGLV